MDRPLSHAERIARERKPIEKPALKLVEPGDATPEADELPDDGKEYRAYMSAKAPPRLRLKPGWRKEGYSIQWYPAPVITDDLDRESAGVPQVIAIVAAGGRFRIEGFHLDKLMDDLNRQVVAEIRAYCPRRWPGKAFGEGEGRVKSIVYEAIDGRTTAGKAAKVAPVPVPQETLGGEPPEGFEVGR